MPKSAPARHFPLTASCTPVPGRGAVELINLARLPVRELRPGLLSTRIRRWCASRRAVAPTKGAHRGRRHPQADFPTLGINDDLLQTLHLKCASRSQTSCSYEPAASARRRGAAPTTSPAEWAANAAVKSSCLWTACLLSFPAPREAAKYTRNPEVKRARPALTAFRFWGDSDPRRSPAPERAVGAIRQLSDHLRSGAPRRDRWKLHHLRTASCASLQTGGAGKPSRPVIAA